MKDKVKVSVGFGKFTSPGVGAMTLVFPAQMPRKVRSLTIINGANAVRELGVAARNLTALTLISSGDYAAYVSFSAPGGGSGNDVALAPGVGSILADCSPPLQKEGWWKGNLHTHTNHSDGDASPEAVLNWYAASGYDFVSITDHDKLTSAQSGDILVLPGTEVTAQNYPALHMAAVNITNAIPKGAGTPTQAINAVLSVCGPPSIPILAHPGWQGPTVAEIAAATGLCFIEVYSGIPSIGSSEQIWDAVLMARIAAGNNAPLYGVAGDDAHVFASNAPSSAATPGRGWVMVRAATSEPPTSGQIYTAMKAGDFYSSSGVTLETLTRTASGIAIEVQPEPDLTYVMRTVVGRTSGVSVTEANDTEASYELQPGDLYARLVAVASNGQMAWSQPVMA